MTLPTYYNTGSAAVSAGGLTVTGTGTGWGTDSFDQPVIAAGDFFMDPAQPEIPPQRIASVTDATHLVLARPWPGANVAGPYEVQFVGDIVRSTAQTRRMLEGLTYGLLFEWIIALSHEDGQIAEQVGVITVPIPRDIEVFELSMWLNEPSNSGDVATDIMLDGISILSPKLFVKQGQHSSDAPGTTAYGLSSSQWNKGQVMRIDFLTPGSNAAGAKLTISGQRRN
ncbi:MAG: hypothetical protein EOP24_27640 [Hyphomicrobiales bacterium]|nr:MAG: hypothetical protein EOP24_27640 [Hyphomicrobiales bacterium]